MFVLPPPPRYNVPQTTVNATGQPVTSSVPVSNHEMTNVLSHPAGQEYQLSVGEGSYVLQDSLHLATPPPHPQDAPVVSSNPLATTPSPPKVGVRLSICVTDPRKMPPLLQRTDTMSSNRSTFGTYSIKENEKESRSSHESHDGRHPATTPKTPVFGEENALLNGASKDMSKRKKPKTNLIKSNSQFISRVIPHDQLSKRLADHNPEGRFVFANIDRAYQWLDLSSPDSVKASPLMKILFAKANILCHDVNPFTKSSNHLDVIMGASTGDIVWFEAFSQKYVRINKGNIISSAPVSHIRWLPGSENLFLASHMDGTLIVYDKDREDAAFIPESEGDRKSDEIHTQSDRNPLHINKSVHSKNQKANPVAAWKISNHRITSFAFAPDSQTLAVISEDGSLRIINYLKEKITDIYSSYYGAFICVCWSPDGKYILTGGQDDLVSIWSLVERRIVARCPGHHSWVTAVAFDSWRCDGRNYRFGSVGEDRRLLLWDFNVGMLRRPRAMTARHRASISSHAPGARNRAESSVTNFLRSTSSLNTNDFDEDELVEHKAESRTMTAELPPVMSKIIDEHPMSWLGFEEDCIVTTCVDGHVRTWSRPKESLNESLSPKAAHFPI